MLRQFAGKSGFSFLVYYVGKGEEDESIPADHSAVEQIRKLDMERAGRNYPVRLKAVVTYFDGLSESMFVQDATGGIWARHAQITC